MQHLFKQSDIQDLKAFAITMSWAFPAVFTLLLPWLFGHSMHWWPLVITAVMLLLYVLYPKGIYYPYRVWMAIALVLGWINTRIILFIAFYLLIMPIGLVMRMLGKLQYKNKAKAEQGSYYIKREEKPSKQSLENPF